MPGFSVGYNPASLHELMVQPLIRAMTRAGRKPKPRSRYNLRYLPDDHPVSLFRARWKLKEKIINTLILKPQPDALDTFHLEADELRPLIRDDACGLLGLSLTSSAARLLLQNVIGPHPSPAQNQAVIEAIFNGRLPYAETKATFLTMTLTDDELRGLENYLTIRHDEPRKMIIMKLLMSTEDRPKKLEEIIARLQEDRHRLKRRAAGEILHIVRRRRDEPLYLDMHQRLSSGSEK